MTMFIADETGNLFPHQLFVLRGQEVTEKSSEKEETKTIVFVWSFVRITPCRESRGRSERPVSESPGRAPRKGAATSVIRDQSKAID
jgi:hypothetical protein